MKKRKPTYNDYTQAESLAVRTGEHCPETGWWHAVQPDASSPTSRFVGRGNVMPAAGGPSLWVPSRS